MSNQVAMGQQSSGYGVPDMFDSYKFLWILDLLFAILMIRLFEHCLKSC